MNRLLWLSLLLFTASSAGLCVGQETARSKDPNWLLPLEDVQPTPNIPTLKQVLDLYWGRMPLNIEIKSITNLELLLQLLDQYPEPETPRGLPWILISSFDHDIIQNLDQLNTPWPLAPITDLYHHQVAADFEPTTPYSWHFDDQCLDFNAVQELHSQGIPSLVFTVNDSARASQLKQHGIAGIFTDFPSKMMRID